MNIYKQYLVYTTEDVPALPVPNIRTSRVIDNVQHTVLLIRTKTELPDFYHVLLAEGDLGADLISNLDENAMALYKLAYDTEPYLDENDELVTPPLAFGAFYD